jgi:hypothetical protein
MKNQTLLPTLGMVLDGVSVGEKANFFSPNLKVKGQGPEQGLDEASTDEDRATNASPTRTGWDGTGTQGQGQGQGQVRAQLAEGKTASVGEQRKFALVTQGIRPSRPRREVEESRALGEPISSQTTVTQPSSARSLSNKHFCHSLICLFGVPLCLLSFPMAELLFELAQALNISDKGKLQHDHDSIAAKQKVYVDEVHGSDETGSGIQSTPWKTPLHALVQVGGIDKATFLVKKDGSDEYAELAKAAGKRLQKTLDGMRKKEAKAASTVASSTTTKDEDKEEAIVEDKTLPAAVKIKIRQAREKRGVRVLARGWVNNVRVQSRKLVFVDLRDGSDEELQCVFTGRLVSRPDLQT